MVIYQDLKSSEQKWTIVQKDQAKRVKINKSLNERFKAASQNGLMLFCRTLGTNCEINKGTYNPPAFPPSLTLPSCIQVTFLKLLLASIFHRA